MNLHHNKLSTLFNVHPGEGRLVWLLLLYFTLLGAAINFMQTAAFALFLTEFNAQTLPYIFIANSIVITPITAIYLRLGERLSFRTLLTVNLGFSLLLISVSRFGLTLSGSRWLVFALPIFFQVVVNFAYIAFWTLANRLFTVRQGKRLFGLVGSGQWLGIIITGFMIPFLVGLMGTANLLFLAAAGIVSALSLVRYITHSFADSLAVSTTKTSTQFHRTTTNLLTNRYPLLIFSLVLLWWIGYAFVDNLFYDRAAAQFPDAVQLASFLGIFLAVLGIFSLFINFFVAGPIISRFGVRISVLILPITLATVATVMALTGTLGGALSMLFWLATLNKLFDSGLGFSIDRVALTILYGPLPAKQRSQAQTVSEGIVNNLGNGLAGLAILSLNAIFVSNTLPLIYGLLTIVIAWIVLAVVLGREYPAMLRQALTKRRLSGIELSLEDASCVAVLQQALYSPHTEVVIFALNMLAESKSEALVPHLPDLLAHPSPEVRLEGLRSIERRGLNSALEAVGQRVQIETSPTVRGATLRTLATLGKTEAIKQVYPYLNDPDPRVKLEAIIGLLCNGEIEATIMAEDRLARLAISTKPDERVLAAQVIGAVATRKLQSRLARLLRDEMPQVRREALVAAGKARYLQLWPLVMAAVFRPEVRSTAAAALIAGGETVMPEVQTAFTTPGQDREVLIRLVRICGRIGGNGAISLLKNNLDFPDENIRSRIVAVLNECGYRAEDDDQLTIQQQIQAEVFMAVWTLAALVDLGDNLQASTPSPTRLKRSSEASLPQEDNQFSQAISFLKDGLNYKLAQQRDRIFYLLSFIYDASAVLQVRGIFAMAHPSKESRAYALETLDILIATELKTILFPLLRDLTPQQQLERLQTIFPQPSLGRGQRLREIIADVAEQHDPWIKACALYAIGKRGQLTDDMVEAVVSVLSSGATDPLVQETAIWTLVGLDSAALDNRLNELRHDPDPKVVEAVKQLEATKNGGRIMLSTIEKLLILKTVNLFSGTPDEILVEVAMLLEEIELGAGETIFEKGEQGDSMYITVSGQVRVHDEDTILDYAGEGDVFGEMAVLDPEPRLASVTTVEDTLLLRLDQGPFYELMEDRIEVVRGITRTLSNHVRHLAQDLNEARVRVQELEQKVL